MSLLFRKPELRSSFQTWWGSDANNNPVYGNTFTTALTLIPVYAATGLIADSLASSPWSSFEKTAGVPQKSIMQPQLLTDPGVNELDLFSWKHQLVTSLGLWGNAYGYILAWDNRGVPSKVAWLRPDLMFVDENESRPKFYYNGASVERTSLIHIPLYVVPGSVVGLSPIGLFRTQIETGVEAQKTGKNFFRRGGVPNAVLKNTNKTLTSAEASETKKRFLASTASNEPFVAGADWDYNAITLPSSDVNFVTGMKFTANQIAAIYRVDPEDVGGETGGSTLKYATLEMNEQKFNGRTLLPIATRIEAVTDRYLDKTQYVKFNLDARVRSDIKTRYQAHAIAIQNHFGTDDEARALEEKLPLTESQRETILRMGSATPAAVAGTV